MDRLKPCPFCGGKAVIMKIDIPPMRELWRVECSVCGAATWYRLVERDFAVEAWNRRAKEKEVPS